MKLIDSKELIEIADCSCGMKVCVCMDDERILRWLANGNFCETVSLSKEDKERLIDNALWAAEGGLNRADLADISDQELADKVLWAWNQYVISNC